MKNRTRLAWMGSMLAGVVALGCQGAPPQPAVKQPRARVSVGSLSLQSEADFVFAFKREDCGDKAAYGLKQAADKLNPRVARIELVVRDPYGQEVHRRSVTRAEFNGECDLFVEMLDLPLGTYKVTLTGFDFQGHPISTGENTIDINAQNKDSLPALDIQCNFDTGKLVVHVDCCGVSPSPGPTATPTPTPTSTPTPTPMPSSINPSNRIGWVASIAAGQDGSVYLVGLDPNVQPTPIPAPGALGVVRPLPADLSTPNSGNVTHVAPDLTLDPPGVAVLDNIRDTRHAVVTGSDLYAYDVGSNGSEGVIHKVALPPTGTTPTYTDTAVSGILPLNPWGALGLRSGTSIAPQAMWAPFNNTTMNFYAGNPSAPTTVATGPNTSGNVAYLTSDLDGTPIWTSNTGSGGIKTWQYSTAPAGQISPIWAPSSGLLAFGIFPIDVSPSKRVYAVTEASTSSQGEVSHVAEVYLFDPSASPVSGVQLPIIPVSPTLGVGLDGTGGNIAKSKLGIKEVQLGPDGYYYFLVYDYDNYRTFLWTQRYYVQRYRLDRDVNGNPTQFTWVRDIVNWRVPASP